MLSTAQGYELRVLMGAGNLSRVTKVVDACSCRREVPACLSCDSSTQTPGMQVMIEAPADGYEPLYRHGHRSSFCSYLVLFAPICSRACSGGSSRSALMDYMDK